MRKVEEKDQRNKETKKQKIKRERVRVKSQCLHRKEKRKDKSKRMRKRDTHTSVSPVSILLAPKPEPPLAGKPTLSTHAPTETLHCVGDELAKEQGKSRGIAGQDCSIYGRTLPSAL